MYLKHLKISGFKSFAKKSELEFCVPITAIVGPNGSGKSNVAEAFRFVLGEQSVKSMRGKRGEDLIWGGSDAVSRGNRASVEVLLDNQKRVFPLDFDEIKIERVVHRDGQNEYSINESKVRLKDVQELLAAANIGPTGHHIISQGEADRILSATPKDRREMIEDALGLKVYQYKKQEALKKLQKTESNIERVEGLRREVAPHLKFLERQVKKIEKSIELREQLSTFYKEYLRREDVYIAHHNDRLVKAKSVPVERLAMLEKELAAAKQKLAELEQDEKRNELVTVEEKLSMVRSAQQKALREHGSVEGQIQFLERRIETLKAKSEDPTTVTVSYDEVRTLVQTVEKEVEQSIQKNDPQLFTRVLQDVVHSLKRFLGSLTNETKQDASQEEEELVELRKQLSETDIKVAELSAQLQSLETEYQKVKSSIEAEASDSREVERDMFRIMNEQKDAQSELVRCEAELRGLERDREEFKRELQEAVSLIGRAASQYFEFEIVVDGKVIGPADIAAENRELQRDRRRELEKMKIRLEELGGANEDIEKEYKEVKERDDFLAREIADLEASVGKLNELIADLNDRLNEQFVTGLEKIDTEFNRFFTLMFGGGSAKLERVKPKVKKPKNDTDLDVDGVEPDEEEEEQVVEEGIDLDVKLPNKRVKGLDMLSGGERALTSIALIFAMSQVNPPLFVILDETDAALDEANSRRYGDMIEALAEKSQLILITHNRETMSRAGILYGVTMSGDGVSKLLSVKFDEALENAK